MSAGASTRMAAGGGAHRLVLRARAFAPAPAVHDVLRSPGAPLDGATRAAMEPRFGHSFADVRVHAHLGAARSAAAMEARAYAAGSHIVFGAGEYAPGTVEGRGLIAHELAHVAMQDPALGTHPGIVPDAHPAEAAARAAGQGGQASLPRAPLGVYRSPMPRGAFERQMRRFGVGRIFTATYEEQAARLNHFAAGARPGDRLPRDGWAAWDPGADSLVYDWVLAAFAGFAERLGGTPSVQEIGFYRIDYEPAADATAPLVPEPATGAAFGGGQMAIYESVTRTNPRPLGRSTDGAHAAVETPAAEPAVRENVAHELGHGLVETAMTGRGATPAPDAAFMDDFRRAAGWTAGSSPALYDAGVAEVQAALAAGTVPPERYRITGARWNDPAWVEQPVTRYVLQHPSEDAAEAVAMFVARPELLRQRSPRRFAFLQSRTPALRPHLQRDLSTIRLFLTPEEVRRAIGPGVPRWLQPLPPPRSGGSEPAGEPLLGPRLQVRF